MLPTLNIVCVHFSSTHATEHFAGEKLGWLIFFLSGYWQISKKSKRKLKSHHQITFKQAGGGGW